MSKTAPILNMICWVQDKAAEIQSAISEHANINAQIENKSRWSMLAIWPNMLAMWANMLAIRPNMLAIPRTMDATRSLLDR